MTPANSIQLFFCTPLERGLDPAPHCAHEKHRQGKYGKNEDPKRQVARITPPKVRYGQGEENEAPKGRFSHLAWCSVSFVAGKFLRLVVFGASDAICDDRIKEFFRCQDLTMFGDHANYAVHSKTSGRLHRMIVAFDDDIPASVMNFFHRYQASTGLAAGIAVFDCDFIVFNHGFSLSLESFGVTA